MTIAVDLGRKTPNITKQCGSHFFIGYLGIKPIESNLSVLLVCMVGGASYIHIFTSKKQCFNESLEFCNCS